MDIKKRAQDILSEMTIEQKLGQIIGMYSGGRVPVDLLKRFPNGLGSICFIPGTAGHKENAELSKQQDQIVRENWGMPAIRHNEALCGPMSADGAVFPSAIAMGATWDPELLTQTADISRKQLLAEGTRQALSPVMDVARDIRWGRVGETYGEDPTLCAAMSVAFVKGMQTDDLQNGVIATGKHFLGYGMGEGGLNMAASQIPARELREVYAKPFQAAITEANLASAMNSYGAIDGELVIGAKSVLIKLLREELGFDGVVVSDYMAIDKLVDQKIVQTQEEAGLKALKAGMDVELPTPYGYTSKLISLLEKDEEAQKALDRAVTCVLEAKLKLGLETGSSAKAELADEAYNRELIEPVSKRAARESIVLLKNNGVLPLKKGAKKIALIGPHADSVRLLFGCYTYPAAFDRDVSGSMQDMPGMQRFKRDEVNPYQMPYFTGSTIRATAPYIEEELRKKYAKTTPTILEALQEKDSEAEIRYAKGCDIAGDDCSGFAEAEELAVWADAVIVVMGGKYGWGTSCTTGEGVDCDKVGLPGVQEKLAKRIQSSGKPCIFVHMDAKPLSCSDVPNSYDAILENWYPGDTGGAAICDVLYGEYNPAGRLPISAVRNEGQIPLYSGQKNGSGYRPGDQTIAKYAEGETSPLYAFGHGLSYTSFVYSDLEVQPFTDADGSVEISCIVENTGAYDGDEVVQLYVGDEVAQLLRPAQELAGFCRVYIPSGEKRSIKFRVRADQFAYLDSEMQWFCEAGKMLVKVGAASDDIRLEGSFEIRNSAVIDGRNRGFYAEAWSDII